MLVFTRYYQEEFFTAMWGKPWLLALFALVLAILLISEIPMFSLKLTSFSWNGNALLYCFLGAVIIGFVVWGGSHVDRFRDMERESPDVYDSGIYFDFLL